jgi:hypothetical protein
VASTRAIEPPAVWPRAPVVTATSPAATNRRATLHGINVGCGIWLQWRSKHRKDTNAFNLPFDGPGTFKVKLVRTGVRIFMYIGKDGSEPKEIAHFR